MLYDKLINTLIDNKIGKYKLEDSKKIIIKFEIYNKYKKIFLYLNVWDNLINLYKIIPNEHKHFYEVIGDYCKFFIVLIKDININYFEWNNNIEIIKNKLKSFFKEVFKKNIEILEYRYLSKEKDDQCHLIIINYCFNIKEMEEDLCKHHVDEQKSINEVYYNLDEDINIYKIKDILNVEKRFIKEYIYYNYIDCVSDIINIEKKMMIEKDEKVS